jgi:hypothetical protein
MLSHCGGNRPEFARHRGGRGKSIIRSVGTPWIVYLANEEGSIGRKGLQIRHERRWAVMTGQSIPARRAIASAPCTHTL